jgi:hypothetical protein
MTTPRRSVDVRSSIVHIFRRDLVGPGPQDADLAAERLNESPSRWYLTGFLAPADDPLTQDGPQDDEDDPSAQEEMEIDVEEPAADGAGGAAGDAEAPEAPNTKRRFLPSSIGLPVLLPPEITEIEARVSWGDYRTEPPLSEEILSPDEPEETDEQGRPKKKNRPLVEWIRAAQQRTVRLNVPDGRGDAVVVPESAAAQRRGGGLTLETHARLFTYPTPDGEERVRALTVFLVNRRTTAHRFYADVSYVFQARLELVCAQGFRPRRDISAYRSEDPDMQTADLHYRDVREWAVGRNAAASWDAHEELAERVTRAWTEPLPQAEVERVAPNEDEELKARVTFGMEALAERAVDASSLGEALAALPALYSEWIEAERKKIGGLAARRRATAERLTADMETARKRIIEGINILSRDDVARTAFRFMNLAVARAARRRNAGASGDPAAQPLPEWRPFQLAFILLNIAGLSDRTHADRELADLLFFPTGGGKTEAYLGLAAFVIARRRLTGSGVLGAGVAVIMRYTLRLLTLDQLARAAGVVCALELMRVDPKNVDAKGRRQLGDWPIEIGLWVGSDASPNRLGKRGDADQTTAVGRVRRYKNGQDRRAPAPLKACPWCGTPFRPMSFACVPNESAPRNLEIRCANAACDFTRDRPLPILTVDEPIYRRLPAFLIATVDKFAGLPWLGEAGAFFGHVDRFEEGVGFYGAGEPGRHGRVLDNGWKLDPPDLIIQDELHLIAGPLGTVAGLYEAAIDQLASRKVGEKRIRPKIVASTATVRRANDQIRALFDRPRTSIFPPPGIDRTDSFFARTVSSAEDPARLYLGIAAQGRGPKLVFLRALTTLLAAAQSAFDQNTAAAPPGKNPADPYMTALCYFNALRELGGARRIVEDEVRDRTSRYGTQRRRVDPNDRPFADRMIKEPMEITSRVSTDDVAKAKQRLDSVFGRDAEAVDVALATNMISVGLDILRLGLMVVQGQPKTAAEYIQATSRIGRDHNRPGLVVVVLNLHKPRDRTHFEQFGNFHRSFYRAVEATSVTPWAARALDRALAAVVVTAARHIDPSLTPDAAVKELKNRPTTRAAVRDAIVARAPAAAVAGGSVALASLVDTLLDAWITTSDEQSAGGNVFGYADRKSPHRLLHMPLAPEIPNLSVPHQRFVAGRSMRDVEPSVAIQPRDPRGYPIANADDLA